SLAPQFADDGHFGEVIHRVEAAMPFALGLDDATLIPPLELAGRDAGQRDHLLRCEPSFLSLSHDPPDMFETIVKSNVSNILGMDGLGSSRESVEKGGLREFLPGAEV